MTTQLAGEVGHGCNCFVCYLEMKIAPIDIIWLFSLNMDDYPAILWLPTLYPYRSACDIGVAQKTI